MQSLVLGRIRLKIQTIKKLEITKREKINIKALWHESAKELYRNRLTEKIQVNPIKEDEDIDKSYINEKEDEM